MKIIQYLVENGLDKNLKNGRGGLPIHYASTLLALGGGKIFFWVGC